MNKDEDCIFLLPMPVIVASEADMEGDAKEAGASMAVATVEVPMAMEGVQVMEETEDSVIEPSLIAEERAKGDHAEGVLQQHEQFEWELRVTSMDYRSPVAKEAVARALGRTWTCRRCSITRYKNRTCQDIPRYSTPQRTCNRQQY